ncbi:aminoglycoside adenyltransferase [Parafrankia elaeagni]|uniref:aminoglycoside adenyltransferase n=1 Tax=Parafrankia elaeagni TaxID=222534 RepID=UPI001E3C9D0C|nr:aminoglycoside adenyltransferase [Parafrankia elaeagni]
MIGEFVAEPARPRVTAEEFIGPDGAYRSVASMATLLLVGCVMIGVVQGLWSGEPTQALLRLMANIPVAVLAILGFPWIVDQLVTVADVMADWVLRVDVQGADLIANLLVPFTEGSRGDLGKMIPRLFVYLGVVLIYLEFVARNGLIYIVVALAPLSFMAVTMPAAKVAARKAVELVVAIILIKPAAFIALRVGLDFARPGLEHPPTEGDAWGRTVAGLAIVLIAAFMPWIIWRLMPAMEQAMVAQGVARAPFRAGMQIMQQAYFGSALLGRLRGGAGAGQGGMAGKPSTGAGGGGLGPPRTLADAGTSANGSSRRMTRDSDGVGGERRGTGQSGTSASSNQQTGPGLRERSLGDPPPGRRRRSGGEPPSPPGGRRGPARPRGQS